MYDNYVKMPWCIIKNKELDGEEKIMVSIFLAFKKSGKKTVISNARLSEMMNQCERSIKSKKKHLEELGLINVINKRNSFNSYLVSEIIINEDAFNKFFGEEIFENAI